jgi:hypothetical protein
MKITSTLTFYFDKRRVVMKKEKALNLNLFGHCFNLRFGLKTYSRRDREIIKDYRLGYSVRQLAQKNALTDNRILQILNESGARRQKWRKMSSQKKEDVFKLWKDGLSKAEIGRCVGVSRERVRQILNGV